MNSYHDLIHSIADQLCIGRGTQESERDWRARVIYSILGQMAYSSLYDVQEDLQPVSIVHFKQRIAQTMHTYQQLDSEMVSIYSQDSESLCDEIFAIFLATGQIYHSSYRICPSSSCVADACDIVFSRGLSISTKRSVSGLGCYFRQAGSTIVRQTTPEEMFQLPTISLHDSWMQLLSSAVWMPLIQVDNTEYLRTSGSFRRSYWESIADRSGIVSLMRTGLSGSRIYYLYRFRDGIFEQSQLPVWQVEGDRYRDISNCCLGVLGTLPPFTYRLDGAITQFNIGYLPPPSILNMIKLYSWPVSYIGLPHDFNRVISTEVFLALRLILEKLGYQFMEE